MSENGPREGTRDLPRSPPESGRRAVTEDSPAGLAYSSISKSLRRRRAELAALVDGGVSFADAARAYQADHPLEPIVTISELEEAVAEFPARGPTTTSADTGPPRRVASK
jgi:hypothetical protein